MANNEDTIISPNNNEDEKYQNEDVFTNDVQKEEEEGKEVDVAKFDIFSYPADPTLLGYFNQWKRKELSIPEFQRNYVWDTKTASKLIESFLIGIPVPPIFLYKPKNENKYWVIDGQQRIKTIVSFMQGYFMSKNPQNNDNDDDDEDDDGIKFKLKKVNKKWQNKSFSDLDKADRFQLENSVMRTIIIKQINENDEESIYHIFERLNTGGVNLSHMEIRMCISQGDFAKALKKMNEHPIWRKLLNKPKFDKRCRDVEWILRIIALNDGSIPYTDSMKDFLNKYMTKHANPTQEWLDKQMRLFECAIEKANLLGDKPFRIGEAGLPINQAVMDSILVALMSLGYDDIDKEKLQTSHKILLQEDSDYFKNITHGRGTNHKARVEERLKLAKAEFEKNCR